MGITFKGVHSNSIPVIWKSISRPFLPLPKIYTDAAPEADGEYDFSEFNEDGRLHYNDRVFEGIITTAARHMTELQVILTKVARWLVGGWGSLIFDDMPDTIWMAKIENVSQIGYELGKVGSAAVYFRVKPFSNWYYNSNSGAIELDSPVSLYNGLPLDFENNNTFNFTNNTVLNINNLGDWYTKPVIEVTGSFGYIEIRAKKTIRYNGGCQSGQIIKIDCLKSIIEKDGVNDSINSIGDFFELDPGDNSLTILSDGNGQITFNFEYQFINGAVIEC